MQENEVLDELNNQPEEEMVEIEFTTPEATIREIESLINQNKLPQFAEKSRYGSAAKAARKKLKTYINKKLLESDESAYVTIDMGFFDNPFYLLRGKIQHIINLGLLPKLSHDAELFSATRADNNPDAVEGWVIELSYNEHFKESLLSIVRAGFIPQLHPELTTAEKAKIKEAIDNMAIEIHFPASAEHAIRIYEECLNLGAQPYFETLTSDNVAQFIKTDSDNPSLEVYLGRDNRSKLIDKIHYVLKDALIPKVYKTCKKELQRQVDYYHAKNLDKLKTTINYHNVTTLKRSLEAVFAMGLYPIINDEMRYLLNEHDIHLEVDSDNAKEALSQAQRIKDHDLNVEFSTTTKLMLEALEDEHSHLSIFNPKKWLGSDLIKQYQGLDQG